MVFQRIQTLELAILAIPEMRPTKGKALTDEFQRFAITSANSVMLFWLQRIVVVTNGVKGWLLPASHFMGYELGDALLD
jgi:hypothetical protein